MADILIATYPLAGHTLPLRPIARELVKRDHRVRYRPTTTAKVSDRAMPTESGN